MAVKYKVTYRSFFSNQIPYHVISSYQQHKIVHASVEFSEGDFAESTRYMKYDS